MVRVELAKIMISDTRSEQVVWLKEKGGTRNFPIIIGPYEAMAIQNRVLEKPFQRPLTHDLLVSVIEQLGGKVQRLEVRMLKDSIFYAWLVIEQDGHTQTIDCRPSDGIAVAVRAEAPIFVAEEVMDEVATEPVIEP